MDGSRSRSAVSGSKAGAGAKVGANCCGCANGVGAISTAGTGGRSSMVGWGSCGACA
ncbi:hypothetical protein N7U49_44585 [Streptomyces sp. AD2-2]|nr:hypothetical protein N7U49_44585 [Streptomyces sp. AD2-2]